MKIVCFSDLHISNRNSKYLKKNGISDLLDLQYKYVEHVCQLAKDQNADVLLFLGDWTDYATLDPVTLGYSNRCMALITELDMPFIMIEGNHCIEDAAATKSVVGATRELIHSDSIHCVFQQEMVRIESENGGTANFYCYPYISNYGSIRDSIRAENAELDASELNIGLFHFPTINAVLDNGLESKKGVDLNEGLMSNFDCFLGGDFHLHQQLVNNSKAWYCGAPFDLRFGEHTDRGTMIVDIQKGVNPTISIVPNPYQMPIRSVSFDEVCSMSQQELSSGIYRVSGSVDRDQAQQLSALAERAYSLSWTPPRIKTDLEKWETELDSNLWQDDDKVVRTHLKRMNCSDVDKAMQIFSRISRSAK